MVCIKDKAVKKEKHVFPVQIELILRENFDFPILSWLLKGILLLNAELGNYQMMHDPEFEYKSGDHINFYCPVCHHSLGIPKVSESLAKIRMIHENGEEFEIVFSIIAGKELTMKIKNNTIIESFGDGAEEYQNYWGEVPRY